jgi:DNA-binding XRE family transcriptional regulator
MKFHKVKAITPLDDYILLAEFENSVKKLYDVKPLFDKWEVFKALKRVKGLFDTVKIDMGGYGIVWNDDIDLACDEIWDNGTVIDNSRELWETIRKDLIKTRQTEGLSQKKLESLSGVNQPIIARMEKGNTSPNIDTILKILAPLGKTLAIVSTNE